MTISNVARDACTTIVASDAATATIADLKVNGDKLWLQCRHAVAFSGNLAFLGSLDGANYAPLTLPAALIVHGTPSSGTVALSGNTILSAAIVGKYMLCLVGVPRYVQILLTRTGGGAAANLTIDAMANEEGDGY